MQNEPLLELFQTFTLSRITEGETAFECLARTIKKSPFYIIMTRRYIFEEFIH